MMKVASLISFLIVAISNEAGMVDAFVVVPPSARGRIALQMTSSPPDSVYSELLAKLEKAGDAMKEAVQSRLNIQTTAKSKPTGEVVVEADKKLETAVTDVKQAVVELEDKLSDVETADVKSAVVELETAVADLEQGVTDDEAGNTVEGAKKLASGETELETAIADVEKAVEPEVVEEEKVLESAETSTESTATTVVEEKPVANVVEEAPPTPTVANVEAPEALSVETTPVEKAEPLLASTESPTAPVDDIVEKVVVEAVAEPSTTLADASDSTEVLEVIATKAAPVDDVVEKVVVEEVAVPSTTLADVSDSTELMEVIATKAASILETGAAVVDSVSSSL